MEATNLENRFQELCFLSEEANDPKLKLILLIHAINLHNNLKCTGIGENDPEGDYILPPNWTKDSEGVYSLRYFDPKSKETVYLKFVTDDDSFDINGVTASKNDKIASLELKTSEHKNLDTDTINKLHKRYKDDFLLKLLPHLKSEEQKQTESTHVVIPPNDGGFFWTQPRNDHRPPVNPFGDYGRSDLFPTSTNPTDIHTGGNLLGPRNPIFQGGPNQPTHGAHPFIRYDPTGPDDIDPTNPDPDLGVPPFPFKKYDPKDPRGPFGPGGFGPGGFGPGGGYGGGFGGGMI